MKSRIHFLMVLVALSLFPSSIFSQQEMKDMRTAYSRTWKLANGKYRTVILPVTPA